LNFFGGKLRRHLLELAGKFGGELFDFGAIEIRRSVFTRWSAIGIVRIGGKAETEGGAISFAAAGIKLGEARGTAEKKDEYSGGERIESAEMADLAEADDAADGVDNIVRSFSGGFIDYERAIEGGGLLLSRHSLGFLVA
jgi:hypothetical protein